MPGAFFPGTFIFYFIDLLFEIRCWSARGHAAITVEWWGGVKGGFKGSATSSPIVKYLYVYLTRGTLGFSSLYRRGRLLLSFFRFLSSFPPPPPPRHRFLFFPYFSLDDRHARYYTRRTCVCDPPPLHRWRAVYTAPRQTFMSDFLDKNQHP